MSETKISEALRYWASEDFKCDCHEAYIRRNLRDPACFYCNNKEEIESAIAALPLAEKLEAQVVSLRAELEQANKRIADLNSELNKGDSWAWIRQKFESSGRNYKWLNPRTDDLVGTRYEVMGWLHVMFGNLDGQQCAWEICLEQQKRADVAEVKTELFHAELDKVRAQVEQLIADKARLDWLQAKINPAKQAANGGFVVQTLEIRNNHSMRQSIDYAMKESQ